MYGTPVGFRTGENEHSLLVQSHNATGFVGFFTSKQYKLLTHWAASCFSELDIHCLNANNPPKITVSWDCASSELRVDENSKDNCLQTYAFICVSFQERLRYYQSTRGIGLFKKRDETVGKTTMNATRDHQTKST